MYYNSVCHDTHMEVSIQLYVSFLTFNFETGFHCSLHQAKWLRTSQGFSVSTSHLLPISAMITEMSAICFYLGTEDQMWPISLGKAAFYLLNRVEQQQLDIIV